MHSKVFVKLKKTLKILLSGQKTQKNPKNPKNPKKTKKKPTGLFFLKKTGVFSNPARHKVESEGRQMEQCCITYIKRV